jgi:hypothetical protein
MEKFWNGVFNAFNSAGKLIFLESKDPNLFREEK